MNIAIQDGKHTAVTLRLIADQVGNGIADGTVQLADHDFGFRGRPRRCGFDKSLASTHDNSFSSYAFFAHVGNSFEDVSWDAMVK